MATDELGQLYEQDQIGLRPHTKTTALCYVRWQFADVNAEASYSAEHNTVIPPNTQAWSHTNTCMHALIHLQYLLLRLIKTLTHTYTVLYMHTNKVHLRLLLSMYHYPVNVTVCAALFYLKCYK